MPGNIWPSGYAMLQQRLCQFGRCFTARYSIVAGVPARMLRRRFPEALAEKLLRVAWWEWDRATLEARFADLNDVERFVERYG